MNNTTDLPSREHINGSRGGGRRPDSRSTGATTDGSDLRSRIVEPSDFVADTAAFVDVRLPRSTGKASYSFVGPGVSQNPDQAINITEPHGYNIGAASMPAGVVNNPHLHFTAEVFICTSGHWRFDIGAEGDQSLEVGPGSIFSVPTWIFRGFENVGSEEGWLFTVLGRDDTGGILWAPSVLERAAATGLYLSSDLAVLDTERGDTVDEVLQPLTDAELAHVEQYSDEELTDRLAAPDDLRWSDRALLSSVLPDHRCSLAPVIGFGLGEDRRSRPLIVDRHGFAVEWLRIAPGSSTGQHRHGDSQVVFVVGNGCEVQMGSSTDLVAGGAADGSVVSMPRGVWRDIANTGDDDLLLAVVTEGDGSTVVDWHPDLVAACREAGWTRDANGCVAPVSLVG